MKTKVLSFFLIILTGSLAYPVGYSMAATGPVAFNDSYTIAQNGLLQIHAPGVLANDTVSAGKTLTASLVSDVRNGTLFFNANGSFTYVPVTNFHGSDEFRYLASDGTQNSTGTVMITVIPTNHTPVAQSDRYSVNENSTLTIGSPGVLGNDTNPDSTTLSAILVSNVMNGVLTLHQDGSFTYTPNSNFHGVDSFTYHASNTVASSNVVPVTIVVNQTSGQNGLLEQLIAQIQQIFAQITGLENEITDLKNENTNLESRVHNLETHILNGTGVGNSHNQTGDDDHDKDDDHKSPNNKHHGPPGNNGTQNRPGNPNSNKQKHEDNQDD